MLTDADPSGQYLLSVVESGEKSGIYEVSISDRKCISLLPDVVTFSATFARDGKSFMYAVASRGEVRIYRQKWNVGKLNGSPQVALKVPFAFPLVFGGNAYDFSALSENLERPNERASFREEAVRLDSGECMTTNSRKS